MIHFADNKLCNPGRTACWLPTMTTTHTKNASLTECAACKKFIADFDQAEAEVYAGEGNEPLPHTRYRIRLDAHLMTISRDSDKLEFLMWQLMRWRKLKSDHCAKPVPGHFMTDYRITINDICARIMKYGGRDAIPVEDKDI